MPDARPSFTARLGFLLPLVLGLLVVAQPAQAQWKWRDANGRVTVSDRPPPASVSDKDILQRPAAARRAAAADAAAAAASEAASGPTAKSPAADKELEKRRLAAEQEQRVKAQAEAQRIAAVRAENCKRARNQLATLESGVRIGRVNDKGEREILDDRARAEEVQRARGVIASDCGP